jgi:hypothetical protein
MKRSMLAMLLCAAPLFAAEGVQLQPVRIASCHDCDALWADFNGDGLDDVLHQNQLQLNEGGKLAPEITVAAISGDGTDGGEWLQYAADFNGDHFADVVVADLHSKHLLLGDGTGQFPIEVALPQNRGAIQQFGDFTGDGRPDVLTLDVHTREFVIWRNLGDGSFRLHQELPWPSLTILAIHSDPMTVADINGDGRADLIISSPNHINFYIAQPDGKFAQEERYTRGDVSSIQAGDVNADGKRDVVIQMGNYPEVRLITLFGDGTGRFPETAEVSIPDINIGGQRIETFPQSMVVGDFVAGGGDEIAVSEAQGDVVVFAMQSGRLVEVARAPFDLHLTLVRTVRFRSFKPELIVTGTVPRSTRGESWTLDTTGELGAPERHPTRGRALGRGTNFVDGQYEVSVQSDCPIAGFNSFTFHREGIFVDFVTGGVIAKADAVYTDFAINATFTMRDGEGLRVLDGSLAPTADGRLVGKFFESGKTPCGHWQVHDVTAVAH